MGTCCSKKQSHKLTEEQGLPKAGREGETWTAQLQAFNNPPQDIIPENIANQNTDPTSAGYDTFHPSNEVNVQEPTPIVSGHYNLWNKDNPEEQHIVGLASQYKELLNHKRGELVEVVDPVPLWVHLKQLGVINTGIQETLQVSGFQATFGVFVPALMVKYD